MTEWAGFRPVMVIHHHDRINERYKFICPHGRTEMQAEVRTGEEMAITVGELRKRHNREHPGCTCAPMEFMDRWDRLRDAIEQHQEDLDHPPTDPVLLAEAPAVAARLARLRALGCDTCDPAVATFWDVAWDQVRQALIAPDLPENVVIINEDARANEVMRLVHERRCPHYEPAWMAIDGTRGALSRVF